MSENPSEPRRLAELFSNDDLFVTEDESVQFAPYDPDGFAVETCGLVFTFDLEPPEIRL